MVFQPLHQKFSVKELGDEVLLEHFFYTVVIFIFPKPYTEGNEEAEFLSLCPVHRNLGESGGTEGFFRLLTVDTVFTVDGACQIPDFFIQIRNTKFKGMGHGHLICFEKDIVGQPQMHV